MFRRYKSLEPARKLRNEGRELLGEHIIYTVKRDGENVGLWLNEDKEVIISSRRQEIADSSIQSRMKATPEYKKVVDLLNDEYSGDIIVYGELLKTVSPTRIEPRRKHIHWVIFDIWDCKNELYMPYSLVYQLADHYKIPIVPIVDEQQPMTMTELFDKIEEMKKWSRRHHREGVVGKVHNSKNGEQIFFKEKIDLPKRKKVDRKNHYQSHHPPMPEEKIIRALQHAYGEVGADNWKDTKIAMPAVARYISTEAREHNYNVPRNMFNYYVNTPLEIVKGDVAESQGDSPVNC